MVRLGSLSRVRAPALPAMNDLPERGIYVIRRTRAENQKSGDYAYRLVIPSTLR